MSRDGGVLGSSVCRGAPAERALLISDLHVPSSGGVVVDRLDAAIRHAQQAEAALFVLGDLFDSYVSARQVRTGVWRDVAARFLDAALAGTRVVLLVGNRDFLLGSEFAAASRVELVHGGYRAQLGGVDTLLLHGDELCQNDLPYQRAKRWLRSAPVRWLARRLPLAFAERVAERARQRSQTVVKQGDQQRFLPSQRAVQAAFATGVSRLVFGHIHRRSAGRFERGDYRVLPAFDEAGEGLMVCKEAPAETGWMSFAADGQGAGGAAPATIGQLVDRPAAPCPWSD